MNKLKELLERKATLINEMRAMNEEAKDRSFTDEEKKSYSEKEAELKSVVANIETEERQSALNGFTQENPSPRADNSEQKNGAEQKQSFFRMEKRANDVFLSVGTGANPGGAAALAPEEFMHEILKEVEKQAILYGRVRKLPVSGAGSLGVPYEKTDATAAEWTNEIPSTEIGYDKAWEFGKRSLSPTDLVKQILVTKKLLATSAFPIDTLAKDKIAEKLTSAFENCILNGTGENQPLGVFTASADGIPASRDVETGATAISADDLINMKMSLRPEYRSKAVWVMSTELLKDVMKLKATDGRYLWQPAIAQGEPATILGLPVIESEYAPSAKTAGSYVAVLGDFSHYWFAYWKGIDITVLNEKYAGTNQIGFLGHTLADGQPTLPAAFARLKIKAASQSGGSQGGN